MIKKYTVYATAAKIIRYDFEIEVEAENEEQARELAREGNIVSEEVSDVYFDDEQFKIEKVEQC